MTARDFDKIVALRPAAQVQRAQNALEAISLICRGSPDKDAQAAARIAESMLRISRGENPHASHSIVPFPPRPAPPAAKHDGATPHAAPSDLNPQRTDDSMRAIAVQKRTTSPDIAEITEITREFAAVIVSRQQQISGSRMNAYADVASSIGTSSVWLRKFLGRRPDAKLSLATFLNLRAKYEKICALIEAKAEIEQRRLDVLTGAIDAAVLRGMEMVGSRLQATTNGAVRPTTQPNDEADVT